MKDRDVKICWMSGTLILILTTAMVLMLLPSYDRKVARNQEQLLRLEHERDMRFMNYQWFLDCQTKEKLCEIEKFLSARDDQISKAHAMMKHWRERGISKLYTAYTDRLPSKQEKEKWGRLSMEELIGEADRIQKEGDWLSLPQRIQGQEMQLQKTENRKTFFVIGTAIIQIVGLLLINISQYLREYACQKNTR